MFFENGPGKGGPGKGLGDRLLAFPFSRSARDVLFRVDADWGKAALDLSSVNVAADGTSVVARLSIPFKVSETPMLVRFKALFRTRPAVQADAEALAKIIGRELAKTPDGTKIGTKLVDIRRAFNSEMKGDATLRSQLLQDDLDFFVVEIIPDMKASNRG
jgi:hypothetical protein